LAARAVVSSCAARALEQGKAERLPGNDRVTDRVPSYRWPLSRRSISARRSGIDRQSVSLGSPTSWLRCTLARAHLRITELLCCCARGDGYERRCVSL
jgi:hypothetical protein